MSTADHLIYWLLIAASPAVNLYPLIYAFRPWRSTPQGRALMLKALGNMVVIDVILAFQLFGDYPGRDIIRVAGFGLFCAGVWYLLFTLLTAPNAREYPPRSWARWVRR